MKQIKKIAISEILRYKNKDNNSYFSCKIAIYDYNFNFIEFLYIPFQYGYGNEPIFKINETINKKYKNCLILKNVDYGYTTKKKCKNLLIY